MVPGRLRCLAALAAALVALAACAGPDSGDGPAGPDPDPTSASEQPSPAETPTPSVPDDLPSAVAELCATYVEMAAAVAAVDPGASTDEVVEELVPVMRGWAEDLAGAERPPEVPADVWAGVELLAERILALPEEPTYADLEAVASGLSPRETELFTTASSWFLRTCEE